MERLHKTQLLTFPRVNIYKHCHMYAGVGGWILKKMGKNLQKQCIALGIWLSVICFHLPFHGLVHQLKVNTFFPF